MRLKLQTGFNLVELIVSMAIGLVLMLSLTTVFVDSKVSSQKTADVTNLQQQAQLALQVLIEDVRSIGSWAEFSGNSLSSITTSSGISFTGCSLAPASGANATSVPVDANWISDGDSQLEGCNAGYELSKLSDVFSFSRIQGSLIDKNSKLEDERYYLATTPQKAHLFLGKNIAQIKTMKNADIYPYIRRAYFVEVRGLETPRLSRFSLQNKELINDLVIGNIERFKIDFGFDSSGDGNADFYKSSDLMLTSDWQGREILSARIYVLARADHPDATFNNNLKYNERYLPFEPADNDHYRRLLLSTTVNIKNNKMVTLQ